MTALYTITGRPSPAELAQVRRALRQLEIPVPTGQRGLAVNGGVNVLNSGEVIFPRGGDQPAP